MFRSSLVLLLLIFFSVVRAQSDTLPVYFMLGYGGGLPIFQSIDEQSNAVDLFTHARDHSTQLHIGVQFNNTGKNKLELFLKRTRFSSDRTELAAEFQNRYPDQYFYPSYSLGNGGPYPHFTLHSLNCNYGRELGNSKIAFLPYAGVGVGLWSQRDFYFILRDKNSNFATEYEINLKKNVRPTYSIGARFGINKFPMVHLDLSIHGGPNNYRYDILAKPQDPNQPEINSNVSYKRMVQSVNLVLIFKMI